MGKFDRVLLASDYDGTLYDSLGVITEQVKRAIRYFTDQGGYFTVSTGRSRQGFHSYSPDYINAPVLVANGAMAYDYAAGRTVFVDGVPAKGRSVFERIVRRFPGMCVEFYTDDFRSFAISPDERTRRHFNSQQIEWTELSDLSQLPFPVIKIMIGAGDRTFEVQDYLQKTDLDGIKYIPCAGDFVELHSATAGKGSGLLRLADHLGVPRKNAFAVGDGSNDVDMLQAAAIGFVPCNGDALALNAADRVVRSNDEGAVAHVIEMLDELFEESSDH